MSCNFNIHSVETIRLCGRRSYLDLDVYHYEGGPVDANDPDVLPSFTSPGIFGVNDSPPELLMDLNDPYLRHAVAKAMAGLTPVERDELRHEADAIADGDEDLYWPEEAVADDDEPAPPEEPFFDDPDYAAPTSDDDQEVTR
jgi:hypothetical protein